MEAKTPVLLKPCFPLPEIELARNQPEFQPIHVLIGRGPEGIMTTRFELSPEERQQVAETGQIWLQQYTYHERFTPIKLLTEEPPIEECI